MDVTENAFILDHHMHRYPKSTAHRLDEIQVQKVPLLCLPDFQSHRYPPAKLTLFFI